MTATSFDGIAKSRRGRNKCVGRGIYLRSLLCGLAESSKCFRHSLKSTLTQYGCHFGNNWKPTIFKPFYISELAMFDTANGFQRAEPVQTKSFCFFFFGFVLLSKFNFPGRHSDAEVYLITFNLWVFISMLGKEQFLQPLVLVMKSL